MAVVITGVTGGSPAARKKIKPGDRLVSINGHAVEDVLDYRFYMTDEHLEILLCDERKERSVPLLWIRTNTTTWGWSLKPI